MNQTANDCPDCGTELRIDGDPEGVPTVTFECPECGARYVGRDTGTEYVVEGRAGGATL